MDSNPKTRFGALKPNLSLVPPAAIIYQALALQDGANKYGPYNWRKNDVSANTYIAAAMRHISQYLDGEDLDPSSGYPHLAHALASLSVLVDAIENNNLIDDRPPNGPAAKLIRQWTRSSTEPVQLELPLGPPIVSRTVPVALTEYADMLPETQSRGD